MMLLVECEAEEPSIGRGQESRVRSVARALVEHDVRIGVGFAFLVGWKMTWNFSKRCWKLEGTVIIVEHNN